MRTTSTVTGRLVTSEPSIREADRSDRNRPFPSFLSFDFAAIELRLMQSLCLHRDEVRHYEANRLSLKCVDCGRVSPGWEIGK